MDATLIAALLTVAGAAAATMRRSGDGGELGFVREHWSEIAQTMRRLGTPDAQIDRFRAELFAAL